MCVESQISEVLFSGPPERTDRFAALATVLSFLIPGRLFTSNITRAPWATGRERSAPSRPW